MGTEIKLKEHMTKRLVSRLLSSAADVEIGLHFIKEDYSAQSGVHIDLFPPLHLAAFHMDGWMDFSPYEKFHHPCPSLLLYCIKNILVLLSMRSIK